MNTTMSYLEIIFPGQLFIAAVLAGVCIGYSKQATRNKIQDETFPIPTFRIGGKRLVKKTDLAEYIDSLNQPGKKKRGRPLKALSEMK